MMGSTENFMHTVVKLHADVVNINPFVPFEKDSVSRSTGTAFFISNTMLMTCFHCVSNAVSVSISSPPTDRTKYKVRVVAILPYLDLALLSIEEPFPHKHSYLKLDDEPVHTLDNVIALGFPLDSDSLKYTTGVVSGIINEFIETTTAINPGSSGGVLLRNNQVIGVNSQKLVDAELVGYAVSIRSFLIWNAFISDAPKDQTLIIRPYNLCITTCNTNPHTIQVYKELYSFKHDSGVIVISTKEPLLQRGDVLYSFNGNVIDNFGYVINRHGQKVHINKCTYWIAVGESITLGVFRNGEEKNIVLRYEEPKQRALEPSHFPYERHEYLVFGGMVFMRLNRSHVYADNNNKIHSSESMRMMTHLLNNPNDQAIVLSSILIGSPINSLENIRSGSLIKSVNGVKVKTITELRDAIKSRDNIFVIVTSSNEFFMYPYSLLHGIDTLLKSSYSYKSCYDDA